MKDRWTLPFLVSWLVRAETFIFLLCLLQKVSNFGSRAICASSSGEFSWPGSPGTCLHLTIKSKVATKDKHLLCTNFSICFQNKCEDRMKSNHTGDPLIRSSAPLRIYHSNWFSSLFLPGVKCSSLPKAYLPKPFSSSTILGSSQTGKFNSIVSPVFPQTGEVQSLSAADQRYFGPGRTHWWNW